MAKRLVGLCRRQDGILGKWAAKRTFLLGFIFTSSQCVCAREGSAMTSGRWSPTVLITGSASLLGTRGLRSFNNAALWMLKPPKSSSAQHGVTEILNNSLKIFWNLNSLPDILSGQAPSQDVVCLHTGLAFQFFSVVYCDGVCVSVCRCGRLDDPSSVRLNVPLVVIIHLSVAANSDLLLMQF